MARRSNATVPNFQRRDRARRPPRGADRRHAGIDVYDRLALAAGQQIPGPVIIEEREHFGSCRTGTPASPTMDVAPRNARGRTMAMDGIELEILWRTRQRGYEQARALQRIAQPVRGWRPAAPCSIEKAARSPRRYGTPDINTLAAAGEHLPKIPAGQPGRGRHPDHQRSVAVGRSFLRYPRSRRFSATCRDRVSDRDPSHRYRRLRAGAGARDAMKKACGYRAPSCQAAAERTAVRHGAPQRAHTGHARRPGAGIVGRVGSERMQLVRPPRLDDIDALSEEIIAWSRPQRELSVS